MTGADGTNLNVAGVCNVTIESKCCSVDTPVYVLKGSRKNLLGLPELRELNLLAVVNAMCASEFDPIKKFDKLFKGLGTMPGMFKIDLKPGIEPVRLFSPRSIAAGLREAAKEEIDKMLEIDVIEPVEQATDWCSGLTIAPKANGKIRMCVDLTNLNKGVRREVYPLPRVSDMLCNLSKGVMFSKLDANSGFWQVKLDPQSKLLTTFVTPWGRFCFKRMPFGISSAPEHYQRAMEKILHGLKGVICLMDDILVFGKNPTQHWQRLGEVLKRIEQSGIKLKKEKCEFGCNEIKFLGHLVSGTGVKPDPDKIKAITEMQPPSNKTEARRFIGMSNYLLKFSKQMAELCAPINAVSGSKTEWFWGPDQQKAFEDVKHEIARAPVLCPFDLNARHRVSADASKNALGAVLLQFNEENGYWQPVEYASRKMTETEKRYAMIEKEALAITWACEKFDYYLVGRNFEIESDHKPLIAILGEKDLSSLPVRVQRFKLRLMRYGYDIFHTPGKDMYIADTLSRPNVAYSELETIKCDDVETYVHSVVSMSVYSDLKEQEILDAMGKDKPAIQCLRYMHEGWPEGSHCLHGELVKLYTARNRLSLYNGLIMYEARIYIPLSLRTKYLELCHEGHQGVAKCRARAQRHFWWPGLSGDINDFVSRCNVCIMHSQVKHQPMHESELPSRPWEIIGSDIFVLDDVLYVVIVDYYSKWIEALPVEAQTSKAVINVMKQTFSCFGFPNVVRSDNGRCYDSKEFRKFANECDFVLSTSSPRYPPSNGLAESAVKTVKRLWKKCEDHSAALMAYRTTPLPSGFSPSELMFGRPVKSKLGISYETDIDYGQFEEIESDRRKKIKRKWDKKYRVSKLDKLKLGQTVYVKAPSDVGSRGIVVREDNSPESYWVRVGQSEIRRNRKHLFVLHPEIREDVQKYDPIPDSIINVHDQVDHNENVAEEEEDSIVSESESDSFESSSDTSELNSDIEETFPPIEEAAVVTRSGRQVKPPNRYDDLYYD